jgi:hypothetical protein
MRIPERLALQLWKLFTLASYFLEPTAAAHARICNPSRKQRRQTKANVLASLDAQRSTLKTT